MSLITVVLLKKHWEKHDLLYRGRHLHLPSTPSSPSKPYFGGHRQHLDFQDIKSISRPTSEYIKVIFLLWVPSTEQMADPFDIRFRTAHHRNRWAYHGAWYAENNPDFIKLSKDDVLVGGLIAELRKSGLMAELLVAFPDTRDFGDNLKFLIHEYLKHGGDLGIVDYFRMCLNAMRKYDIETMLRKNGITPSKGTFKACDVHNALKVACNGKEVGIECVKGEDGQYYLYQVAIGVDDELNLVDSDMKKIMGGCKSDDPIIYESYDINGYELGKINQEKQMSRRRDYGAGSRCCRVCGNHHGVIQKYGLMCCRRCFRSNAKHMGFIKYR